MFPSEPTSPPNDGRFYTPVEPPDFGDPFCKGYPCRKCKRFCWATITSEWFTVPKGVVFSGIALQKEFLSIVWIGSQEVFDAIKKADLRGWQIEANVFRNG